MIVTDLLSDVPKNPVRGDRIVTDHLSDVPKPITGDMIVTDLLSDVPETPVRGEMIVTASYPLPQNPVRGDMIPGLFGFFYFPSMGIVSGVSLFRWIVDLTVVPVVLYVTPDGVQIPCYSSLLQSCQPYGFKDMVMFIN